MTKQTIWEQLAKKFDVYCLSNILLFQLICSRMKRTLAPAVVIVLVLILLYEFNLQHELMKENLVLSDRADDLQVSLEVCRNKDGTQNAILLQDQEEISIKAGAIDVSVKKIVESRKSKSKSFKGHKLVHIDLKGAPPKMSYLLEVLPFLKDQDATGILVEYEDMFPYQGKLKSIRSDVAYSADEIQKFLQLADELGLYVVPLVQTFGHLEFVLEHDKFKHLREAEEYANAPCPSKEESQELVIEMIGQVLDMHPDIGHIHVGGDEVYNMKSCKKCKDSEKPLSELYLQHMLPVLKSVRDRTKGHVKPIIWDDMLRKWLVDDMKVLTKLTDIMVWGYVAKLEGYPLFPADMFTKFTSAFDNIWLASSFKGARAPNVNLPPVKMHVDNHLSWLKIISSLANKTHIMGVALTGWTRFDHFATLCELFPAAIPSLSVCLQVLKEGEYNKHVASRVGSKIGFKEGVLLEKDPFTSYNVDEGKFPGSEVYSVVAELENHISWYNDNKVRLDSWAGPRQVKKGQISMLQVEGVKSSLKMLIPSLTKFEDKVRIVLRKYFYDATIEEWITDKILPYIKLADELASHVQHIITKLDPSLESQPN